MTKGKRPEKSKPSTTKSAAKQKQVGKTANTTARRTSPPATPAAPKAKRPAVKASPRKPPRAAQIDSQTLAAYDSDMPPGEITSYPGPIADTLSILRSAFLSAPIMDAIFMRHLGVWQGPLPRNPHVDPWDVAHDLAEKLFIVLGGERAVAEARETAKRTGIMDPVTGAKPEIRYIFSALKKEVGFSGKAKKLKGGDNKEAAYQRAALAAFDRDPTRFSWVRREHLVRCGDLFALHSGQEARDFENRLLCRIFESQELEPLGREKRLRQQRAPTLTPREAVLAFEQRLGISPQHSILKTLEPPESVTPDSHLTRPTSPKKSTRK